MAVERSIHQSLWLQNFPLEQRFAALETQHDTDVLVVGGGITGLSIALELLQRGYRVTVCEANTIGGGTTGGSSGHLDAHPEMGPKKLLKQLGEEKAREYTRLRLDAIHAVGERAGEQCGFHRVPAYYYSEDPEAVADLQQQCDDAGRIGLDATFRESVPLPHAKSGYRIEQMARIDCMAYLRRLTELVTDAGGQIFENTMVSSPSGDAPRAASAGQGTVTFQHLVFAVHCNFTDAHRLYLQTPAYQSYVMSVRIKGEIEDALFWDDQSPYFYTRRVQHDDPHTILVGGCDHRTGAGQESRAQAQLESYIRERFEVEQITGLWSAELFEPSDGLPIIGAVPGKDQVWIATGLSGVGLTWGTAAGKLIAQQLAGDQESPLKDVLSPSRFGLSGAAKTIAEQMTSLGNLAERILPAEDLTAAEFAPGQGAVGEVDGKHVAVCRDRAGCKHRHSAICTHMGGVLHWNEVEQTWDCTVHGGRFAPDGTRLYGPPEKPLDPPG